VWSLRLGWSILTSLALEDSQVGKNVVTIVTIVTMISESEFGPSGRAHGNRSEAAETRDSKEVLSDN
jgi:hypothetical protein